MRLKTVSLLLLSAIMAASVSACNNQSEKQTKKVDAQSIEQASTIKIKHLTKEEFLVKVFNYEKNTEWLYTGSRPCIVDFYASWCGPCRKLSPILEELAGIYEGKIDVYKVDVDKEKELAAAFGVSSIPTLIFIPMKGNPQISSGFLTKEQLIEVIDSLLLQK